MARCWPRCSLTVASDVSTQWPKDGFVVIKTYHESIIWQKNKQNPPLLSKNKNSADTYKLLPFIIM